MATQTQRSAATQARLLDATIALLVERGVQRATTAEICRRAGVSKGAMLHHYPSKTLLLAGAVEHLVQRRLAEFNARFNGSEWGNHRRPTSEELDAVFETLWSIYSGPTLSAWMELVVASRTDPELLEAMSAVNARFQEAAQVVFATLFGVSEPGRARSAARLVMAVFDGLAMNLVLEGRADVGAEAAALFRSLIEPWRRHGIGESE